MINIIRLLLLIVISQLLLNIVLASSDCAFNVDGQKAKIIDNCKVIETREGDKLKITFNDCQKINNVLYEYTKLDGEPLYNINVGRHIEKNILVYNDNFVSYDGFLKTIIYINYVYCYEENLKYVISVRVYPSEHFASEPTISHQTNDSIQPQSITNINTDKIQINYGDKNTQNTPNNLNLIKDFIFPIVTGIIVIIFGKIVIDRYSLKKNKTKKPKSKS